jgi:hypothetical protein
MSQWEFIEVVRLSDEVYVVPQGKIDLRWLTQSFPQSRIDGHTDRVLDKVSLPSMREAGDCYSAVIAYAGSQGWQPFAAEHPRGQFVSFRRSSPAY